MYGYGQLPSSDLETNETFKKLREAGCEQMFIEKIDNYARRVSGTRANKSGSAKPYRNAFNELRATLRPGDILVVADLLSLGKTTKQFLTLLSELGSEQVDFKCLNDSLFDTTTRQGKTVMEACVRLSELESSIHSQQIKSGLKSGRARGRQGGRPKGSYNQTKAETAVNLYQQGRAVDDIVVEVEISRSTLYKYLRAEGVKIRSKKHI